MDGATCIELASGPTDTGSQNCANPRLGAPMASASWPLEPEVRTAAEPGQAPHGPYALAVTGQLQVHDAIHPYRMDDPDVPDDTDSAPYVPHGVYTRTLEPVRTGSRVPWDRTVIYEMHVKGFTKLHPDVPEELCSTYAGLAHPAVVDYLAGLGVTSLELLLCSTSCPSRCCWAAA